MILSSHHVHTQFCDGKSTAEDMVLSALDHGFSSIGFSSHAKQHFDPPAAMSVESEAAYIAEINRLRDIYGSRIRIWLGTELDFFSCADTCKFEYFLGAVHYMPTKDGFSAVDSSFEDTKKLIDTHYRGDGVAMACDYYKLYAACIRARRPAIAAHIDLVRKYNKNGLLFDESSSLYKQAALDALTAVKESGAILEVNTGAMARIHTLTPYPDTFLLQQWHDMDGEVILGSDCHNAPDIMAAYPNAISLMMSCGYKKARVLGTGAELFEETDLCQI